MTSYSSDSQQARKTENSSIHTIASGYISILRDQGLDLFDFYPTLQALSMSPDAPSLHRLDAPELKAALACCTLIGLCNFVLREPAHSLQRLETGSFLRPAIQRCNILTSFLAFGSLEERQAYAFAIRLLTAALARHRSIDGLSSDWIFKSPLLDCFTSLLQPLSYTTDTNALQSVREILTSSVWWEGSTYYLSMPSDFEARDPMIAQIYWIKGLFKLFRPSSDAAAITRHLERCPTSVAGLHPVLQNNIVDYMPRFSPKNSYEQSLTVALFRLSGTLDDAKAVTRAIECLEYRISRFDELYYYHDATHNAQHFIDAKEALEKLKETTRQPGFAYKALSLRLDEGR
ncbi:hypothetical protein C8J56DRAFT_968168 [Mycena floridula]|nr:hypothetical protein C8J56DRAFT_968168 [Mycena floridula]